jgi:RNA polymerase sigma-70 factor (ECF subfamily)
MNSRILELIGFCNRPADAGACFKGYAASRMTSVSPKPFPTRLDGGLACVAAAWQAHEAELRGFLKHQVPDGHAADDLLQDVFLKAMRQGTGFCSLHNPRAWLFQVARHAVIDRARTARHLVPLDEGGLDLPAPTAEPLEPVDALAVCVDRVLGELAPADALILQACDIQGQTQRDFAAQHGLSLPAAKSRLLRARQRMRDRLTTACRVNFDPVDGRVCGHDGRAERHALGEVLSPGRKPW